MIKENELRKGNLFHPVGGHTEVHLPQTGVIFKIIEIKEFEVSAILNNDHPAQVEQWRQFPYRDLSPIAITPEILEKAGFEYEGATTLTKDQFPVYFKYWNAELKSFAFYLNKQVEVPCLCVHHLQNVFYFLTGTELEIKL